MNQLKVYPNIGIAALKQGLAKELRLWTIFRSLNESGCGDLSLPDTIKKLQSLDLRGVTPQTVGLRLKTGEGIFWETNHSNKYSRRYVHLYGLERICKMLDAPLMKRPVILSLNDIKTIKSWRASLYTSWLGNRPNPISRTTLQNISGKTKPTLIAYEKLKRVKVVANARIIYGKDGEDWRSLNAENGEFIGYMGQKRVVLKRLGNSYFAKTDRVKWGFVGKRIRRTSKDLANYTHTGYLSGFPKQSYLSTVKQFTRRVQANDGRMDMFFYTQGKTAHTIKGDPIFLYEEYIVEGRSIIYGSP